LKIALISDIHGNLPALENALSAIRQEKVDAVYCLGDIVGYGASPNECVALLRSASIPCILGNHDAAAIGDKSLEYMNPHARMAIEWTTETLTAEHLDFLRSLPLHREIEDLILLVHASPFYEHEWHYIFNVSDANKAFGACSHPVIFVNPADGRRIINVGSVGQPRDRDPRLCFGIFDTRSSAFRHVRKEYPVDQASQKIIAAGLPPFLASRLESGI
jgi:diadenosine tetraphosphatase ApaH/serine/threonine PP2A family protein phosphatase